MFKRKTENYDLPQWEHYEHPDFLDDMNPAYATIDRVLGETEKRSKDSEEQLKVALPILEKNTDDLQRAQHDISDLQVRVTNEEHDIVEHDKRIQALEYRTDDIDLTLSGFDKNNTVKAATDTLKQGITNLSEKVEQDISDLSSEVRTEVEDIGTQVNVFETTVNQRFEDITVGQRNSYKLLGRVSLAGSVIEDEYGNSSQLDTASSFAIYEDGYCILNIISREMTVGENVGIFHLNTEPIKNLFDTVFADWAEKPDLVGSGIERTIYFCSPTYVEGQEWAESIMFLSAFNLTRNTTRITVEGFSLSNGVSNHKMFLPNKTYESPFLSRNTYYLIGGAKVHD